MKRLKILYIVLVALLVLSTTGASQVSAATYRSGMPWSSGAYTRHSAAELASWAKWRGSRSADNIGVFTSRNNWWGVLDLWWRTAIPSSFDKNRQDLVVAVPLFPESNSLANTGTDAEWRALADQIEASDPNAWVRIGWEMNLKVSAWKVTADNTQQWADAFNRAVRQMKIAAPKLRFVFNPNRGPEQNCNNKCTRIVFQKVKHSVQAYGLDSYDNHPALLTSKAYTQHFTEYGGLQESANYAKANGKLFALPEWGIACNQPGCQWPGNAGDDNKWYIYHYMNFFYNNRANMAFETYFEVPEPWIRSALRKNVGAARMGNAAPKMYITKINQFASPK